MFNRNIRLFNVFMSLNFKLGCIFLFLFTVVFFGGCFPFCCSYFYTVFFSSLYDVLITFLLGGRCQGCRGTLLLLPLVWGI